MVAMVVLAAQAVLEVPVAPAADREASAVAVDVAARDLAVVA